MEKAKREEGKGEREKEHREKERRRQKKRKEKVKQKEPKGADRLPDFYHFGFAQDLALSMVERPA